MTSPDSRNDDGPRKFYKLFFSILLEVKLRILAAGGAGFLYNHLKEKSHFFETGVLLNLVDFYKINF